VAKAVSTTLDGWPDGLHCQIRLWSGALGLQNEFGLRVR
jgi:hypothetical protein